MNESWTCLKKKITIKVNIIIIIKYSSLLKNMKVKCIFCYSNSYKQLNNIMLTSIETRNQVMKYVIMFHLPVRFPEYVLFKQNSTYI